MKRMLLLLLILCILLTFPGCSQEEQDSRSFYYLRTEDTILYGQEDALIVPLPREFSGELPLDALLQLYLDGPGEENYRSPFPKGTYLLSTIRREDMLVVVLSREFSTLDGIRLTLAGACLTATCRSLTGLENIQVRSGEQVYDFHYQDFTFLDSSAGN